MAQRFALMILYVAAMYRCTCMYPRFICSSIEKTHVVAQEFQEHFRD